MTFLQCTPPRYNNEPSFVIIKTLITLLWRTDGALPENDTVAAIFCDVVVVVVIVSSATAKTKTKKKKKPKTHDTLLTVVTGRV